MTILGIPDVVVLEPVDVNVQAVRVHVDVGHKEMRKMPSSTPWSDGLKTDGQTIEFYTGPKSPPAFCTN